MEPEDMQNNFINGSMFIGNMVLLVLLLLLTIVAKMNFICPPPNFLLNPSNLTKAYELHCGYTTQKNITYQLKDDDYPNFTTLYHLIFMMIFPLGLTSLALAKSKIWMPKIQDADISFFPKTLDSLKALMAFILYGIFILYLFPYRD